MGDSRVEHDSMGEVRVPADAYYGAQTQRAVENFPVSGERMPAAVVHAIALVKEHAARANVELGLVPPELGAAIAQAAGEAAGGALDANFVVDVFQTGSGTSTNMNVNEVLAGRANEILGGPRGGTRPVHPNDHVNRCQSSNDVVPTAIRVAARLAGERRLLPALGRLESRLAARADELGDVLKLGRTHLQDAVPVTLGQELHAYATQVREAAARVRATFPDLEALPLGGTAVGTGLNAHPEFAARTIAALAAATGVGFRPAADRFAAMGGQDALVATSAALRGYAAAMLKIAQDLRLLASGPRCAIGEIELPELQPGSSIMPGKVNPVIPEVAIQVAVQVIANDHAVTLGGALGILELNVMLPLIARNLLQSLELCASATELLAERCVAGLQPNRRRCAELLEQSLMMVTPLSVRIGYDRAAALAHEAFHSGKSIRAVLREHAVLPDDEIDRVLDPRSMIGAPWPATDR